jgi:hypothetical protein
MVKAEANNSLAKTGDKTKTTLKKVDADVKTGASAGSSAAIKTGTGIQHTVKPRPASVKMQSQVKTNAGIKIH